MKRLNTHHTEPAHELNGCYVRVTHGPQRGSSGVAEAHRLPVGVRIKLIEPDTRVVVGWFEPAHLTPCERPARTVTVDLQPGLDLLMNGRRS